LENKDEEIFILNMELNNKDSKKKEIKSQTTEEKSIFDFLYKKKETSSNFIPNKEIIIDTKKSPIFGALFEIQFGTWKSKEFGTVEIALKKLHKSEKFSISLEEYKKMIQYDRCVFLNGCEGFEKTFGICEINSVFYLVSESLSGGILQSILLNQNIKLSFKQKIEIAFKISTALMFLHSQQPTPLLFTALKSNLILLNSKNEPKLTCTYFIRFSGSQNVNGSLPKSSISPECIIDSQKKYDEFDEIYAFSIILWEIYFRQPLKYTKEVPPMDFRPNTTLDENVSKEELEFISIIKDCWDEDRNIRPTAKNLVYRFGKLKEKL
jgi:serine/threonine protein kinase